MPKVTETFQPTSRARWRAWLRKHYADKSEIWLVLFKKHTGKRALSYDDAVEEALCFGWIDGILKRIDDEKHVIRFSPRKAKSIWSESNKRRVGRLIREKKMTEAGMMLVRAAKQSGAWSTSHASKRMPRDLKEALDKNTKAKGNFARFTKSQRQTYIAYVLDAKRDETRKRRIRQVVARVRENKKPGID